MKQFILTLAVLGTLFSCTGITDSVNESSEPVTISEGGVTVTCPSGWNVSEEDTLEGLGYSVSFEKSGLNSSGLYSITWVNGNMDLDEWISSFEEEFETNIVYKHTDVKMSNEKVVTYAGIPARSVKFNFSLLGIDHNGKLHFFYKDGKTFNILIQEAIEDKAVNAPGFKAIEESFSISSLEETDSLMTN